jgi:hypothetical protein
MIPLHGFVPGDTCGLLVLVEGQATVATLAALLAQAASVRVRPATAPRIRHEGRILDSTLSIEAAGLTPLDRIDLVTEGR